MDQQHDRQDNGNEPQGRTQEKQHGETLASRGSLVRSLCGGVLKFSLREGASEQLESKVPNTATPLQSSRTC